MRDIAAISGLALIGVGCWLAWPPLGLIVPGCLVLAAAVAGHMFAEGDDDP